MRRNEPQLLLSHPRKRAFEIVETRPMLLHEVSGWRFLASCKPGPAHQWLRSPLGVLQ